ncbi:MAG TPA: hypothetical protein G4O07_07405 [Dehalococcoidia bacterium]|nr:hypothetical protein [Dehalococcoidia bacterium]
MVVETFLVVLNEDSSSGDIDRVVSAMENLNENVSIVARRGNVLLATFTPSLIREIRRLQSVKVVGGVTDKQQQHHGTGYSRDKQRR